MCFRMGIVTPVVTISWSISTEMTIIALIMPWNDESVLFGDVTGADEGEKEAALRNRNCLFHFLFQTQHKGISCRAQCHWEVKAGRIRKGAGTGLPATR